ncbi:hypothetical protein PX554_13925 [Sphingomonas sp. H39-1-10]|uniref:hypothetical protein n=1 Tax=Sphingomonas pollutisoli TaxID=3030829 RepID=UPI0023B9D708|nr:hypothetical protein [Sphingomonas pollutisoli]MDF0489235.1 hypothetical protein [Sphingomonas pollutisoli]
MALFGGLFGHDQVSARAAGKFQDTPAQPLQLPQAPPSVSMGFMPTTTAPTTDPASRLPQAPPRRPGAFDKDHYQQTMLALAAGFFGSQNFGEGLGKAAEAIYAGNADARQPLKSTFGGPDDSFRISTDPRTGQQTVEAVPAFQDYLRAKAEAAAKAKIKPVPARDSLDAQGRLAAVVGALPPKDQAAAWSEGRARLLGMGYEGIPETYSPAYTRFGGTVPAMNGLALAGQRAGETARHNGVMEGLTAARVHQTDQRIAISKAKGPGKPKGKISAANSDLSYLAQ